MLSSFEHLLPNMELNELKRLINVCWMSSRESHCSYNGITMCYCESCKNNTIAIIKILLDKFPEEIAFRDNHGQTILHYACQYDDSEIVKNILYINKHPSFINIQDKYGRTALHIACKSKYGNNIQVIKELVNNGIILNTQDIDGQTPLMSVLWINTKYSIDIVSFLLQAGVDVNLRDHIYQTPLLIALHHYHSNDISNKNVELNEIKVLNKNIIEFLLISGAEIDTDLDQYNEILLNMINEIGGLERIAFLHNEWKQTICSTS